MRTPWCGKPGCEMPEQKSEFSFELKAGEDLILEDHKSQLENYIAYLRKNLLKAEIELKRGSQS